MKALLGHFLQFLHVALAVGAFSATIFAPASSMSTMAMFWIALLSMYVINRGCFLTQLEIYLTGQNVTIVDPLLRLVNLPPTKHNRNAITMFGGLFMLFIALIRLTIST